MKTQIRQLVLAGILGVGVVGSGAALLGVGTVAGAALVRPALTEAQAPSSCAVYHQDDGQQLTGQPTAANWDGILDSNAEVFQSLPGMLQRACIR
jgi:hypothetical protein